MIPATPPTRQDVHANAGVTVRGIITALPDLAIAGGFLVTWLRPEALGASVIRYGILTVLLEFIIVHSAVVTGTILFSNESRKRRITKIVRLGCFYSLFTIGYSFRFTSWWPFLTFWVLTLNRMMGLLVHDYPSGREQDYIQAGWSLSTVYYLGTVFATMLLPVPELGLTSAVRQGLDLPGEGILMDEPHRFLAFGVVYFGLTGLGEILGWARSSRFQRRTPHAHPGASLDRRTTPAYRIR